VCKLCLEHSQPGVKWYLNPRAYSREVGEQSREHFTMFHQSKGRLALALVDDDKDVMSEVPVVGPLYFEYLEGAWPEGGQIVPLEDALQIVDLADANRGDFVVFPCACRTMAGFAPPDTMTCLHFGMAREFYNDLLPEGQNYIELSKDETVAKIKEWDRRGFYHNVIYYAHPDPYVYNMCNCPAPYCVAWKWRMVYGETAYLKGEYIAHVEPSKCTYCGTCAARCPFAAVIMDRMKEKAVIDIRHCAGCGLCESGCPEGAIALLDRNTSPARDLW
jgi:ferredoxin